MKQKKTFIMRLMLLFVIVFVLSAAAILRDGKLFGYEQEGALSAPRILLLKVRTDAYPS